MLLDPTGSDDRAVGQFVVSPRLRENVTCSGSVGYECTDGQNDKKKKARHIAAFRCMNLRWERGRLACFCQAAKMAVLPESMVSRVGGAHPLATVLPLDSDHSDVQSAGAAENAGDLYFLHQVLFGGQLLKDTIRGPHLEPW